MNTIYHTLRHSVRYKISQLFACKQILQMDPENNKYKSGVIAIIIICHDSLKKASLLLFLFLFYSKAVDKHNKNSNDTKIQILQITIRVS